MTTIQSNDILSTILQHIHSLAVDIGARGSTTDGERRGAEYCRNVFSGLGLQPVMETFTSGRSIFLPHLYASILYLVSFGLFAVGSPLVRWIAALLSLLTLAEELLELGFQDNIYRWFMPKGGSQNVQAVVAPAGEYRQDLVLIGHIDTQRTPLIFSTARWVNVYKNFTTVAFVLFALQGIIYLLGAILGLGWVWYPSILSAICALVLAAICIQADATPFTAGANDNASSVAMVLALAEELSRNPLQHTRVTCLCSGCEEIEHFGAITFFKNHRSELRNPKGLVFELLGCAGPGWLTREGIIIPFHSDPQLRQMVEKISDSHPDWGAYPVKISGGISEMADCVRAKVPAITIFGLEKNGDAPYWHQVGDTYDKIDRQVLRKTHALTWELIQEIDRS